MPLFSRAARPFEGAAGPGRRTDRVEHEHPGEPVDERRDRHRRLRCTTVDASVQRLAEPRVRPELEVREPLPGILGSVRHRPAVARRRGSGTARRPSRSDRNTVLCAASSVPSVPAITARPTPAGAHAAAVCCNTPSTRPICDCRANDERVLGPAGSGARPSATPRSLRRTRRGTCAPGRRGASRTRRASRLRARVEPPRRHARCRVGDERDVLHERELPRRPIMPSATASPRASPGPAAQRNSCPTRCVDARTIGRREHRCRLRRRRARTASRR